MTTTTADINDSEQVTFKSNDFPSNVIINPTEDLIPDTTYNLQRADGEWCYREFRGECFCRH